MNVNNEVLGEVYSSLVRRYRSECSNYLGPKNQVGRTACLIAYDSNFKLGCPFDSSNNADTNEAGRPYDESNQASCLWKALENVDQVSFPDHDHGVLGSLGCGSGCADDVRRNTIGGPFTMSQEPL